MFPVVQEEVYWLLYYADIEYNCEYTRLHHRKRYFKKMIVELSK